MDGRGDAMSMSGPPSYYLHRGIVGPGGGSQQPGLHVNAPPLPGMRTLHNPGPSMAVPPSGIGSGAFQMESPPPPPPVSSHPGASGSVVVGGGVAGGVTSQGETVKRKRGRPRKYGLDGNVALALSPISSSNPASAPGMLGGSASGSGTPGQKRGRGRPPGTGRKQQLASFGEWVAGTAGMGFTPHIISVAEGEDIATKIMSFSQQGPRSICILSANGVISMVTLRQPETSGGTVTYEGCFEILALSGSYILADNDGSRSRRGGLSVSLSSPDGRIIGGSVGGLLRAATPVQVIVGSFMQGGSKGKNKYKTNHESGETGESDLQSVEKQQSAPAGVFTNHNVITPSPVLGGWPGSRQLDMRNTHLDIDLTRG